MTFSPRLCLDGCMTLLTRKPHETALQTAPTDTPVMKSFFLMPTAYMFALSDAHFPHFLFYIFAGVSSQRALYPARWPCSGPAKSSEVFLVRWEFCLFLCVFGWKWCHYACSPPLSVTLTKHGPLRRSCWHDRCAAAACAGSDWRLSARCGSRIFPQTQHANCSFFMVHVSYSPLNKVRMYCR